MNWRFFINDTEIEEPLGWGELSINIIRDEQWKGVFFEASTSSLGFYGIGYDILYGLKTGQGLKAVAIFRAEVMCEGESEYEEALRGKLNFAQYRQSCGQECIIRMPVEQDDCTMTLRNRYDQKVNIDSNIAFNKQTILQQYDKLGFTMQLASQEIPVSAEASVQDDEPFEVEILSANSVQQVLVRPIYNNEIDVSLSDAQLSSPAFFFEFVPGETRMSPQLLLDSAVIDCFSGLYDVDIRIKGRLRYEPIDGDDIRARAWANIGTWNGLDGEITTSIDILNRQVINDDDMNEGQWYEFDVSYVNASASLPWDTGIYAYIDFWYNDAGTDHPRKLFTVEFDNDTHFIVKATRICPPTDVQAYAVHELFSRAVEAVTDRCLTVKSDYYGRTDSEPYSAEQDGCGGLRVLTNGLKIRQAENNNFTISVKDIFENLNPIDNIGMGVEGNVLRVESAEYFYNDTLLLTLDAIPESEIEVMEDRAYSVIKIGYKKWETESVKGLDEFNSNKEFRTSITAVNNTLDITSNFVAAGYVIEQIRTQQFISTGRADNKYDNDTFIIAVDRTGYGEFIVEQGNISNPANIFSPATVYNWRLRPMYNLMRWGKSLFQSYVNISETDSKLFYSAGTGNYVASGELTDGCKLENGPIAENADLSAGNYALPIKPILTLDNYTVEYPLSVKDCKKIKANPYGFINLQCGNGEYVKTYIQSIEYRYAQGIATFNLAVKWP